MMLHPPSLTMARHAPRSSLLVFPILITGITALLSGCQNPAPELHRIAKPPTLAPLETLTVLHSAGSFTPSGIAGTTDCAIVLVGRSWGTLARIEPDGRPSERTGRVPGYREFASLETGPDGRVLVWASEPAFLARLNPDLTLDSVPVPHHPWGGRLMGPVVDLQDGGYAIAPLSDRRTWVPSPDPWIDAPLLQIVDADGFARGGVGSLLQEKGIYLTWLANRAVLGRQGQRILVLRLSSGTVMTYSASADPSGLEAPAEFQLNTYSEAPLPTEEVRRYPWITEGGYPFLHQHLPHVETAAFGVNRLYAIRNYDAEWVQFDQSTSFEMEGRRRSRPEAWRSTIFRGAGSPASPFPWGVPCGSGRICTVGSS